MRRERSRNARCHGSCAAIYWRVEACMRGPTAQRVEGDSSIHANAARPGSGMGLFASTVDRRMPAWCVRRAERSRAALGQTVQRTMGSEASQVKDHGAPDGRRNASKGAHRNRSVFSGERMRFVRACVMSVALSVLTFGPIARAEFWRRSAYPFLGLCGKFVLELETL